MRRNLFVVVLIPCILAFVLLILVIMDKQHAAKKAAYSETEISETNGLVNPTESGDSKTTTTEGSSAAADPTTNAKPTNTTASTTTKDPTTATKAPTATTSTSTTSTPKPTSTSTQTQTGAPVTSTQSSSNSATESQQDKTSTPTKSIETDETETETETGPVPYGEYDGLYTQKGDDYTLIADKNSKYFIFINNKDNTSRKTEFTYHSKYAQSVNEFYGPILGYKNKIFVFISQNNIVASNGISETILVTLEDASLTKDIRINTLIQSDNRILLEIDGALYILDCRSLSVEVHKGSYSVDFFVLFTDDYLCFSSRRQIPAGSFYNYLYAVKDGKVVLFGSIGEIDDYVLDKDVVYIQSQEMLLQINLKTFELTSSYKINRERTLYFPVYGSSVIKGLSEIRYINYNNDSEPVKSISLPDFLKAECYYGSPYAVSQFSLYMSDGEMSGRLPEGPFGSFAAIDLAAYPLNDNKFLMHSTVKEKLYSGATCMGEGEIFLLERIETKNNNSVPFEMIYAWIPIEGESRAYQMYIYVPAGDDYAVWLKMIEQLLQVN